MEKPMVLGHESAGVVVEVGERVNKVKVGDKVAMEPEEPCRQYTPDILRSHVVASTAGAESTIFVRI